MVLDLELFRAEKGGNPNLIRESQKKRYKDEKLVDRVIEFDVEWRKARFRADELNRLKKLCSKEIGEKMKKKEPQSTKADLPNDFIPDDILSLAAESLKSLTVFQIKKIVLVIDEEIAKNSKQVGLLEQQRNDALREIGNLVHPSVPVSDNEDNNFVERTWGDITVEKKYSQMDLGIMVDGYDGDRGAVVSGARGYYLK
uniref:Serine-tRNA synthetase type1 N-terminal domain-containing protein n=1 Tax=Romanomermis culicivorax TaxID=13658 RepID=A0A915K9Y5_ROMCU